MKDQERTNDKDFYIELAYQLTPKEREELKHLIQNKGCINCTNGTCRVENDEKVGLNELNQPQGYHCYSWNNPELIGRQFILKR